MLHHMPSTPMTQKEMEEQCAFVSEVLDEGCPTEEEEEMIRREDHANR